MSLRNYLYLKTTGAVDNGITLYAVYCIGHREPVASDLPLTDATDLVAFFNAGMAKDRRDREHLRYQRRIIKNTQEESEDSSQARNRKP